MPDNDPDAAFAEVARLVHDGDLEAAVEAAAGIAASVDDPRVIARALTIQIGQLYNLGRTGECPHLLDRAFALTGKVQDHSLLAGLYALAASIAAEDSFERCVRYLVCGSRELDQVAEPDEQTVEAGHDLAVTYSYAAFHAEASAIAERTYTHGQALGLGTGDHALPEVDVRYAVWLDQRGDTDACARHLQGVLGTWQRRVHLTELWSVELLYYAYAAARLNALGEATSIPTISPATQPVGWEADDLRVLTDVCAAIASGHSGEALELLNSREFNSYTLGAAESVRLEALAHARAGDYAAAWAADRRATRLTTDVLTPLAQRLIESTKTQLDHETLRHTVERYANEALTDGLTGLPNRRHFERWVSDLNELQVPAVVGMIDLDDFSAVNNVHGHLGGDLVLQRVAATLARTLRDDDFVARYGGDEFVVVLPRVSFDMAEEVGNRLAHAVVVEDWHAVVPGTPVAITIGWATLDLSDGLTAALDRADRNMLADKPTRRTPTRNA